MTKRKANSIVALRETVWLALDALRSHKLRSFLTLLGVILAVTTLVVVMSIVAGLNRYVAERIANIGANVFVINQFGIITSAVEFNKARKRPPVRIEDYEYLREHLELATQVAAADDMRTDVRYGNELLEDIVLLGVTANYGELRGYTPGAGRFFTPMDDQRRMPVCFIGADVANRFFPNVDPVGKTLRIGPHSYQIVGVGAAMGNTLGQSLDSFVWIPFGTYTKTWLRGTDSIFILVQARSPELMEDAQNEARHLLRARRHLKYHDEDNFGMIAPSSITSLWERLTANLVAIAVGLTSVFLVVGGIVIMNIMLASVVERTREIGIRKAIGALRRHIVMQFLVESSVLASLGGLLGVLAAMGIGSLAQQAMGVPISTSAGSVAMALGLATSVGLFFGIYPAVRASRLDPIEALRQET